jgi:sterol desaturase/sphingolipid hydroxylase (fatty acid hydroxylase superfamily)
MGFVILGPKAHCFTFFFWVSWKILMITEGHAGYEFKWSPLRVMPFVADPSYHDYHHSHNVGNFAANCYVWDVLFDTNVEYMDKYLKN